MIEPRQQLHVGRGKSRAPTIDGVVNLAPQIFEVLAPYLWHDVGGIPLPLGSVTGLTQPEVDARPMRDEVSAADAGGRRIVELTRICRDIGDRLRVRETMTIGEVFHAEVPPLAMTEGDELAHQNRVVLAADTRKLSVWRSAAPYPMARRASGEILSSAIPIRPGLEGLEELLIGRGHRESN
jgi:hypothetical protein